ncbi:MAG TPA: sugar ABC transporter permease [Candidatus Merdivicinus excrementipullorum]|uniref:Sugar ABC transporter permease n=1 Tax=Candidatus Merdivicinus excrementipullorum TaxID=2840867 RepID=A0A9D1FPC2_9FIRM|nr:sugar ABC transporter permease [Candidatus Merdivicinus excrementipullorum]
MTQNQAAAGINAPKKRTWLGRLGKDLVQNRYLYLMFVPVLVIYILFMYIPMYGVIIAFKDFNPGLGILGSEWVGFQHFENFFSSYYFGRILRNTLIISGLSLLVNFPAPIIFALLLNEIRLKRFKKFVQSVTYFPHFLSTVIVCGLIIEFCSTHGAINQIIQIFSPDTPVRNLLAEKSLFRPIYIISGVWQNFGWDSIIYLAALSGVDSSLYEATVIDGAGRWKQTLHVSIPSILPTIVIMLILAIGGLMNVGWEKIVLLYSPTTYETADVISSFVYRRGLIENDFSFSTAVGLFNSLVNFLLIMITNRISKAVTENSLW